MLDVTEQRGDVFYGTISYGGGTPFPVSGVIYQHNIRMTGSISTYSAEVRRCSGLGGIVGTCSQFESGDYGQSTSIFSLSRTE